ncbi:potassium channel KOR1 [Eutrema salsugineum]|uniref:potassium channel KOR1 n=1 Tax=Eutrema salsugineum TaxID=72664 RepID=UPI000CED5EB1|nr:potassium channel KOR1 [Eutrema salsugineum]XP_024008523.1 potassium channel KOR1 [Eutrema salsugineum]XP_024008524.1 potassium channel KOR1 [Eutrema salsugineum]
MSPLKGAFEVRDLSRWVLWPIEALFFFDVLRQWIGVLRAMKRISISRIPATVLSNPRMFLENLAYMPGLQSKYGVWFKIVRALRVKELFERLESWLDYPLISFLKVISIHLFSIHISGCFFYQLATTSDGVPEVNHTWLSQIQIRDKNLTELGIAHRYIVSVYFASVTLSTVGYGDIHADIIHSSIYHIFIDN